MRLTSFRVVRPPHTAPQKQILEWLLEAHAEAARQSARAGAAFDARAFEAHLTRLARHVCCGPDRIAERGFSVPVRYDSASPIDAGTAARTDWFAREVASIFERIYAGEDDAPDDLVHVTCTGYVSPSGAQRLVAAKGWGERTRVTHAYHMGCYASVPALRIAAGLGRPAPAAEGGRRVDVVHTELCSLHFDARVHTAEQLVVQSLFADGSIRYTASEDGGGAPGLRVLGAHEVIASGTEDAMQWRAGDRGMTMVLSAEVPRTIARTIRPFAGALFARAGLDFARERGAALFAIHPGGPKIIDVVRDALELDEAQVAASRAVLRGFGNMSSATLPHVWKAMLEDRAVASGTLVASVAFGPGLTVCGAVLRKE